MPPKKDVSKKESSNSAKKENSPGQKNKDKTTVKLPIIDTNYTLFYNEQVAGIKNANPTIVYAGIGKLVGEAWNKLKPDEKEVNIIHERINK